MRARVHTLVPARMQTVTLKTARERRGWDQIELAREAGVNQATVSRLEEGVTKNPSHGTVQKLERALGLKPGRLVFGVMATEVHAS